MKQKEELYALQFCRFLERCGVAQAFMIPGTQSTALAEGLRRSNIRIVTPATEGGGAYMANGYARACGRPALLACIPGPGFTNALSGIFEAAHDSVPMLVVVSGDFAGQNKQFALQQIDQQALGREAFRSMVRIACAADLRDGFRKLSLAMVTGEPGPHYIEVCSSFLAEFGPEVALLDLPTPPMSTSVERRPFALRLKQAQRPLLLFGGGCLDAVAAAHRLQARLNCPVIVSASARGIFDESKFTHYDFVRGVGPALDELFSNSDCICAVGYKFTHNGSGGFKLKLDPAKFLHVDREAGVLNANYPSSHSLVADASDFLEGLLNDLDALKLSSKWSEGECAAIREKLLNELTAAVPVVELFDGQSPATFVQTLREALEESAIVLTDSGLNQMFIRAFYRVLTPRGLIIPADFQAMGYGVPAAIGAALAAPRRRVVLVTGDGGLLAALPEIAVARHERLPLSIVVICDGAYGLIRHQQQNTWGNITAVKLPRVSLKQLAAAFRCEYRRYDSGVTSLAPPTSSSPLLIEVSARQTLSASVQANRVRFREGIRTLIGPQGVAKLKRLLIRFGK